MTAPITSSDEFEIDATGVDSAARLYAALVRRKLLGSSSDPALKHIGRVLFQYVQMQELIVQLRAEREELQRRVMEAHLD